MQFLFVVQPREAAVVQQKKLLRVSLLQLVIASDHNCNSLFLHKSILSSAAKEAAYDLGVRFLLCQVLDICAATTF